MFCSIVAGDTPAEVVWRSAQVVAFLDHSPLFAGHVLVVPVDHHETIADLPPELVGPYFAAVRHVAATLPGTLGCTGTFVAMNNLVSQSVPHLHTHVVPRTRGDGLRGFFWPRRRYEPGEAAAVAAALRAALRRG